MLFTVLFFPLDLHSNYPQVLQGTDYPKYTGRWGLTWDSKHTAVVLIGRIRYQYDMALCTFGREKEDLH